MFTTVAVYRITMFGKGMAPWRSNIKQARRDAIEHGLGSYDDWGKFYVTVPGEIEMQIVEHQAVRTYLRAYG